MEKNNRILTILITSLISIAAVVFVYEVLLKKNTAQESAVTEAGDGMPTVIGGRKSAYTVDEVISMIKRDKVYLGDSITIFDNGDLKSSNPKFQGTIDAILKVESNVKGLNEQARTTKIPFLFHLYIFSATIYREQYPEEFTKMPKDSTAVKQ